METKGQTMVEEWRRHERDHDGNKRRGKKAHAQYEKQRRKWIIRVRQVKFR